MNIEKLKNPQKSALEVLRYGELFRAVGNFNSVFMLARFEENFPYNNGFLI